MAASRKRIRLLLLVLAAGASGCSLSGTRAAWWEHDARDPLLPNPHGGPGEAICLLAFAGGALIVHAIGEALDAALDCIQEGREDQHSGALYDSPEGLALRVPHYPGR